MKDSPKNSPNMSLVGCKGRTIVPGPPDDFCVPVWLAQPWVHFNNVSTVVYDEGVHGREGAGVQLTARGKLVATDDGTTIRME